MAGIYIHIPFCRQACIYCDFHFSTSLKEKDLLVSCLLQKFENRRDYLGSKQIDSIYFGGGTPSLLEPSAINSIIKQVEKFFRLSPDAEITLEANPDDLTDDKLTGLKSTAVNRLSIGIQSFLDADLKFMNRAHDAATALSCVQSSFDHGFESISIDLIYGTPTLTNENWKHHLETAARLPVQHLSCYCLTVEPNTLLAKKIRNKKAAPVDELKAMEQFELLQAFAVDNNFDHYEISNLCRDGKYALHNSSYWKGEEYLGIGPSAHSYNGISRQWNISDNAAYIRNIEENKKEMEHEELTRVDLYNEYIMTRLRTKWGVDSHVILQQFGQPFYNQFLEKSAALISGKQMNRNENNFTLAKNAWFISDSILADLFFDRENVHA